MTDEGGQAARDLSVPSPEREKKAYARFIVSLGTAILVCFGGIFVGLALRSDELMEKTMLERARSLFENIVHARAWNASYGGVFVPKGPGVESNPWLDRPDLESEQGTLTKRNPATMTREISEFAARDSSYSFHITSTKPLNPANAPDAFERSALEAFESGGGLDHWEKIRDSDGTRFRYISALRVEESCLECHAAQGYSVGQVRGGISVTFPIDDIERALVLNNVIIVSIALVLSALMIAVVYRFIGSLRARLDEAREELKRLSVTDALTAVSNRRHAMERFAEELAKARRTTRTIACALFDIDDFKKVNDTHGHLVGDDVLRKVAQAARGTLRPYDILGRYGGEEFVVVFPDTALEEACRACERIRVAIESGVKIRVEDIEFPVTVSVGVTSVNPNDADAESALKRADDALYKAKASGKNRTVSL